MHTISVSGALLTHMFTHLSVLLCVAAAVVSLNDSDELSSSSSEEDEEEEEDSGSEVEIIEEVQGNGRLAPLQPPSVFTQPGLSHFLPGLSEEQAAEFSLVTPGTEIKVTPRTTTIRRLSVFKKRDIKI